VYRENPEGPNCARAAWPRTNANVAEESRGSVYLPRRCPSLRGWRKKRKRAVLTISAARSNFGHCFSASSCAAGALAGEAATSGAGCGLIFTVARIVSSRRKTFSRFTGISVSSSPPLSVERPRANS